MAKENKYVRKRCEHGKYSFQCKDCKGCGCKGLFMYDRIK